MRTVTLIADAEVGSQKLVAGVTVSVAPDLAAQWEAEGKVAVEKPAAKAKGKAAEPAAGADLT